MRREIRLAISLVSGAVALALALWYGSSVRAGAERERQEVLAAYGGDLVSVCVASRDVARGEALDETNVRMEEWVAGLLPEGAATSIDELAGKRVTSNVPERAVLCPTYFQVQAGALEVPKGTVAVSVPVDASHAAGGALETGDEVDVYLSGTGIADRLGTAQVITTSSEQAAGGTSDLSWVTLAVEPERVSELLSATSKGTISLVVPGADVSALDQDRDEIEEPVEDEAGDGVTDDQNNVDEGERK